MMGYRDTVDLLRQFGEHARLLEDSGPLMRVQEQLEAAEGRRRALIEQVRPLVKLSGGTMVTPELLDKVAYESRRSLHARQRLADLERGFGWVEEEKHALEAAANSMKERALRLLQTAGIAFEPARGWAFHVNASKE